jgi:single-strand selective monofunctional uracil DNA glycosylase
MKSIRTISRELSDAMRPLAFGGEIAFVYNPLEYAREPHELYIERYARPSARVLLIGMNPGPFGMAQTGVPFGDVVAVRDWMGLEAPVGRPPKEHPKRPVLGFGLTRREGSGKRLWGWAKQKFATPDSFFDQIYVHNYCPLLFVHESGRNVVPEKLSKTERDSLFEPCDRALRSLVDVMKPDVVIGVGKFAWRRSSEILGEAVKTDCILHPSPASPLANKDWAGHVEPIFRRHGIDV